MAKWLILAFLILLIPGRQFSQELLPRGLSEEEKQLVLEGAFQKATVVPGALTRSMDEPPRSMAEWEELESIVITWVGYRTILTEIVRAAQPEVEIIIVCDNEESVRNYLIDRDVNPDEKIRYLEAPFNTVWVRDYGPNAAYKGDVDSLVLVDWIYNRPRPQDDQIPGYVADLLDLPLYSTTAVPTDLVHTGGNFMSDGLGTGFSSKLVLHENDATNTWGFSDHSEQEVDQIMADFLGIDTYVKMDVLPFDGIHHIDMHMKLLDEETLLVGEYPEGVADGPQIEANLQYILNKFKTRFGRDFEVIRIPMPPDQFGRYPDQNGFYRTYANALFINKTVIVPTYEEEYDTTGLRIWREALPGYNIVGIECNDIIPASGAIHCITKEIGVADPLLINHKKVLSATDIEPVTFESTIRHRSGIQDAWVFYRYRGETVYDSIRLEEEGADNWIVSVSDFLPDSDIEYYIKARAESGKVQTRPLPAPDAYFSFQLESISSDVTEQERNEQLTVFPNPASAITCIALSMPKNTDGTLLVRDMMGRVVMTVFQGVMPEGESKYFFHAGDLPGGHYILELRADKLLKTHKIAIF